MYPQRISHAGAEAFRLDQHRHQCIDILDAAAQGQVAQGALLGEACAHLHQRQLQLLCQCHALDVDFAGHLGQCTFQAEARLHAHRQQVQRIGEVLENLAAAGFRLVRQDGVRQVVADTGHQQQIHEALVRLVQCNGAE